jgi:hypothetical protein
MKSYTQKIQSQDRLQRYLRWIIAVIAAVALHLTPLLYSSSKIKVAPQQFQIQMQSQANSQQSNVEEIAKKVGIPWSKWTTKIKEKEGKAEVSQKEAQELLEKSRDWADSVKDKYKKLSHLSEVHKNKVSKQGQSEILNLLGRSFQQQDFVPKKIRPAGKFAWEDFTVYQITKTEDNKGYHVIFVDRAGRTEKQIFYGEDAEHFHSLYRVFQISKNHPMIKPLLNYVLNSAPKWLNEE